MNRDEFLKVLGDSNLLSSEQVDSVRSESAADIEPRATARRIVQRGWLTPWQAEQLLAGHAKLFLGKYKLLQSLGQGGMGAVFQAEHQSLRRIVAIKVMARHVLPNTEAVSRFLREIRTVAALDHPHIVAAYDADCVGPTYFLVMEYVPGIDLKHWIRQKGSLPIGWSCEVIRQAALGLQHAHEHGIVHRDIKPSNLLIVESANWADAARVGGDHRDPQLPPASATNAGVPRVKILDLGLARFASDSLADGTLTSTGEIMGTPDYIAPEQAENTTQADIRADIYSLGCTLFEMLTGRVPFVGGTAMQKVFARINGVAPRVMPLRPDVPARLDEIVARMLARDPAQRQQTPAEIVRQLEPFALATSPQSTQQTIRLESEPSPPSPPASTVASIEGRPDATLNGFLDVLASNAAVAPATTIEARATAAARSDPRPSSRRTANPARVWLAGALVAFVGLVFAVWWRTHGPSPPVSSAAANGQAEPPPAAASPPPAPPAAVAPFDANQAEALQEAWAKSLGVPVEYINSIGMKLRLVPPGEFLRGSTTTEIEAVKAAADAAMRTTVDSEGPQHHVVLTRPFYVGVHEVTQKVFEAVMGRNPAENADTNQPVYSVTWHDATDFCARLNRRELRGGGEGYRLPTEAEWEFACRAGTTTRFWTGDSEAGVRSAGWLVTDNRSLHAVGESKANPFGLFDVHGNVWEWCQDWFDPSEYSRHAGHRVVDPRGPPIGTRRVIRGGAFDSLPVYARSAHRHQFVPGNATTTVGFRIVLTDPQFESQPVTSQSPH